MQPHIVVAGGGYAGSLATLRLARHLGDNARITLIDARPAMHERIRLHQESAGQPSRRLDYEALLAGTAARFRQARITGFAPNHLQLGSERLAFDHLVWALGSVPLPAPLGTIAPHGPDGAARLRATIQQLPDRAEVRVVGGGITGLEMVTELAEAHPRLRWSLVAPELARDLSARARRHMARFFGEAGISWVQRRAEGPEGDLTVWCTGFQALPLAADAGFETDPAGRLITDRTLRLREHPHIIGVGDAAIPVPGPMVPMLMSCRLAIPMAMHAADDLAAQLLRGRAPRPFRYIDMIRCISLGRADGVVQQMTLTGRPTPLVLTGAPAAWLKERICRYTVDVFEAERRRIPAALDEAHAAA